MTNANGTVFFRMSSTFSHITTQQIPTHWTKSVEKWSFHKRNSSIWHIFYFKKLIQLKTITTDNENETFSCASTGDKPEKTEWHTEQEREALYYLAEELWWNYELCEFWQKKMSHESLHSPESAPIGDSRKSSRVFGAFKSCLVILATYSIVCNRNPVVEFDIGGNNIFKTNFFY